MQNKMQITGKWSKSEPEWHVSNGDEVKIETEKIWRTESKKFLIGRTGV